MRHFKGLIAAGLAATVLLGSVGVNSAEARSRHHHSRANAAALGAVLGVFGTIAALAARDRYRDGYYYYGPGPYYGGPYAYAPAPRYYYYRHRYWHHRHW
ncbi:MAG: hypothetical protein GC182_10350 [Rhodopseudomonas sp.]|nr:hypothetical protein [Rhodopseudomonas sp.]